MASKGYGAIGLTGGGTGALDKIDGSILNDGDAAFVIDAVNNNFYTYTLVADSGAAEASPTVISPDANAGNKRWVLCDDLTYVASDMRAFVVAATLNAQLAALGLAVDELWLPAKAWTPHTTNGCAPVADIEHATNDDVMISYLAFDSVTEEYAGINIVMPPSWDRGTIDAKFYWMGASGCSAADTVEWQLQGIAVGDDDSVDTTEFTDTGEVISDAVTAGTNTDLYITAALSSNTSAVTINGTPALGDMINLKVSRNVGGTDDMVEDAYLIGVLIQYGISNEVSAW
jgi:hypothetical protein